MKKVNIFIVFLIIIGIVLFIASLIYKKQSDAIVAEVDPQRFAVSFQKAVKIKAIHVIPGEEVKEGELLLEVERPDLMYDIDKATNDLNSFLQQKEMFMANINSRIQLTNLEMFSEMQNLEEELVQLTTQYEQNKEIMSSLESVDILSDSTGVYQNALETRMDYLIKKQNQQEIIYSQMIKQLQEKKENEINIFDLRIEQQLKELEHFKSEANYLKNFAPVAGTIGDVYRQMGELIPPYTTIMSIYEKNPSIIKAYMNEKNKYNIHLNDQVMVESGNRDYSIEGKVVEIGSRIVSYPSRLLIFQDFKMWGQEIFIEIPRENQFLNGEKVFVRAK